MGETTLIWLATAGGIIAFTCAVACTIASVLLARTARRGTHPTPRPHPPSAPMTILPAPTPQLPPQPLVMVVPVPVQAEQHAPVPQLAAAAQAPSGGGTVLEGRYPQLGRALGAWLQTEDDEIERIRIARDLGRIGSSDAATALLDGVRTGVITPTIAADNLQCGGFDAGVAVAAALNDPEPRVRALATSLVSRRMPLQQTFRNPASND